MDWIDWLNIGDMSLDWARNFWGWAGVILSINRIVAFKPKFVAFCKTIFFEFKPFYLPSLYLSVFEGAVTHMSWGWNAAALLIGLFNYWMFRDLHDDDDRWKKRRKKLAEKVEQVGGKLVVVVPRPAASSA